MAKTLKDLPLGAKIKHPGMKYNDKPITFIKVTHDGHYAPNETIFISERPISAKAFDAKEPNNSNTERRDKGNNNYEVSNIDQWLNSTRKDWYSPRHGADQAPERNYVGGYNPYADEAGFLYNFTREALNNIKETSISTAKVPLDGGGSRRIYRKIFLISLNEVGLGLGDKPREGKPFPYFTSDERRKASSNYWLRTPYIDGVYSLEYTAFMVTTRGEQGSTNVYRGNYNVRPALSLSSSFLATKQDADGVYELVFNTPPTISGKDKHLGNISDEISKTYTVFDEDDDKLSIIERLNNTVIGVHNNVKSGTSKTLTITKEDIYKLDIGKRNTISIEVSDGQKKTYRNWTFTRTNTAPVLELITENYLGEVIDPFETLVKVSDIEGDSTDLIYSLYKVVNENETVKKIKINEDVIKNVNFNEEISYSIPDDLFKKLIINDYELVITAIDEQKGESKEIISFKRTEDTIDYYSNKEETEVMSKQIMIMPTIEGNPTSVKIEACNNCFDEEPTWEDVTEKAINMTPYSFNNTSKTADKWGFQVRFQFDGREAK